MCAQGHSYGLGGQTVPCQAEPDPASTEHTVDKLSGGFIGLLKKYVLFALGGGTCPPAPPLATPLVVIPMP